MNILQFRVPILILALLCLGASLYLIPNLKADYNFENFFPKGDPAVDYFQQYQKDFDTDENLLMFAMQNKPTVFETSFLKQMDSLTTLLQREPWISRVFSLTNATEYRKSPFGIVEIPLLKLDNPDFSKSEKRLLADPRIKHLLLSEDSQTLALLMELKNDLTENQEDSLLQRIYTITESLGLSDFHLGGRMYTQTSYIDMLERENVILVPLFMGMVVLVLLLLYRSFWSILVPTLSVLIGLIFLYGYAAAIGRSINLATLMYPTIMAVVGMSDLIHLYTKYQQELAKDIGKTQAILNSLKELRTTLLLTSLTTIIGFLTIAMSPIPHIQTFGFDGAVGVLMAYIIAITLTPVMLSYLPASRIEKSKINWEGICDWIYEQTKNSPQRILIFSGLGLLLALFGMTKVDNNNFALGAIDDSTQLKRDFLFFENELSGVRTFELGITVQGDREITDLEVLMALDKLERHLDSIAVLGPVFSPLTFYKSANAIERGGLKNYALPSSMEQLQRLEKWRSKIKLPYTSKDQKRGRMTAKMRDLGRLRVKEITEGIDHWIAQNISSDLLQFEHTGSSILVDKTNEQLISQMFSSLLLAFFLVSLIVAWLFRKVKMILISLIPNIFPLILTAGVMGFVGVELNGSTAIIFTIAFVIAVDDTIHFLVKFQRQISAFQDIELAIKTTLREAGKGIIITSLVLTSGYFILFFSDFKEAYYHGVLICFTLAWALLADLFLIPILLRRFFGSLPSKTQSSAKGY